MKKFQYSMKNVYICMYVYAYTTYIHMYIHTYKHVYILNYKPT